jgi:hypothetical protein
LVESRRYRVRKVQLLLTVFTVLAAGCFSHGVPGSGKVISESRAVAGFTSVSLKGSGQLTIDENGTESLTITADDNLLPDLISEVRGNQLILGSRDNLNINPSRDVVYKLTVKDLNEIVIGGSGSVDAKGIHTDRLKVVIGGSGTLSAAGSAEQQEITLAGSGDYQGQGLKSKTATIGIMGSGGAVLAASDKLDVFIAGSGSIQYIGDPIVTQRILGSGSVQKR